MASANFVEDALSNDVDESAVNAIVGSLENQLNTTSSIATFQNNVHIIDQSQTNKVPSETHKYNTGQVISANELHSAGHSNSGFSLAGSGIIQTSLAGGIISQNGNKTITMQPPLVLKQGTTSAQVGIQPTMVTVPMSVNSSMSGSIPNVLTLNKQQGQNVVATSQTMGGNQQQTLIPNVQILNMRPGTPGVSAQKSVATVSPRVVIGAQQVVGGRAAAPGIALQTLQGLQAGQQSHLLLKTENGQYQLLRVGPAPTASSLTAPQPQTIRLSTVPSHPGVATVSSSIAGPVPMQNHLPAVPMSAPVAAASVASIASTPPTNPPIVTTQKPSDNTKEKCRNFLANLLDLSSKEPKSVETNVRNLIQELIDALVEPKEFCDRLERLLNASPQPCLIGFLNKSLPLLRQSLVTKDLVIEGINPPPPHVAFSTGAPAGSTVLSNMQMNDGAVSSGGALTTLLSPVIPRDPTPTLVQTQPGKTINIISSTQLQPAQHIVNQQSQKPGTPKSGNTIAVLQNIPIQGQRIGKVSSPKAVTLNKPGFTRTTAPAAALSTVLTAGKSSLGKDKDKKSAQFSSQQFADDKMAGDDDINDVAAMGGVNLAEESQRILGSTELIGTQIRSCKDEYLLATGVLQQRVKAVAAEHGLWEPSAEVTGLVSHAVQERLKNLIEKLTVMAQHRIDLLIKTDQRYEVTQDVKSQLKFLEELDRVEKKKREDTEREMLLRAAKSRSKNEDPEQAKLKAKAKEMQRVEMEEMRQREANLTALQAIGPRKKARIEGMAGGGDSVSNGPGSSGMASRAGQFALRTRFKRVNLRDLLFLLEQERETAHSPMLYRSYLK